MIEQWMHVRAKNTDRFIFENSNRPKFNDGEKLGFSPAKISHWPNFEIDKKKRRSKPKVDEIREIKQPVKKSANTFA